MEQIQSTQNVNLQSPMLAKTVQNDQKPVALPEIKDGDNKSMQYLKYAGAALGAAALVGIACKLAKGKPVDLADIKWKDGKALLKEGSDAFSGKAVKKAKDGSEIITTFKDGVVVQQQKMGKNGFTRVYERDNAGKLTKITQGDVTTLFERDKTGKLAKKTVGKDIFEYGYTDSGKLKSITKNGKVATSNTWEDIKVDGKDKKTLAHVVHLDKDGKVANEVSINYSEKTGKKKLIKTQASDDSVVIRNYDKDGKQIGNTTVKALQDGNFKVSSSSEYEINGKKFIQKSDDNTIECTYDGKKVTYTINDDASQVVIKTVKGEQIVDILDDNALDDILDKIYKDNFGFTVKECMQKIEEVANH